MKGLLFEDILNSVLQSQVSLGTVFFILLLSTVLGFAVSYVYQKTFRGTSYSASFVSSLILLNVITSVVMLVIGSNLARAFGLVGALSVIRFRTAIKDPRDISFIFLSLILGLATGTQNYHIAITATLFVLFLIYALDYISYGAYASSKYFLTLDIDKKEFNESDLQAVLDKATKEHSLNSLNNVYDDDSRLKIVYKVFLVKNDGRDLLEELKGLSGILSVSLVSAENYTFF